MENMALWKQWKGVPAEAQKPIKGGRLNGFTDINPVWRMRVLTENFGPCGVGWMYTLDKQWSEPMGDEVLCFAQISLYYKVGDEWSKPVIGTGGSKLLTKESGGVRPSDEGYKMAMTDALSVACKALGIGADVYWQRGESKYETPAAPSKPSIPGKLSQAKMPTTDKSTEALAKEAERKARFNDFKKLNGLDNERLSALRAKLIVNGRVTEVPTTQMTDAEFETFLREMAQEIGA